MICNFTALKNRLAQNTDLQDKLEALKEGDWRGIVNTANEEGLELSVEEVMQKISKGFFKGHGQYPDIAWSLDTLS